MFLHSAEMSTAVPNHRRTKPGGTIPLHFGFSVTIIMLFGKQCLLNRIFLLLTISQASSLGSMQPVWPDQPPRSLACPKVQRQITLWRGSAGGGSGFLIRTRNTSSWPRAVATEVGPPWSISLSYCRIHDISQLLHWLDIDTVDLKLWMLT